MEKMLWTGLATLWLLVFATALYASPLQTSPAIARSADPTGAVQVANVQLAAAPALRPTHVLGGEPTPELLGLVLGALISLRLVAKRRPI
ncbi:MAG: hypothetical protein ACTHLN_06235 [Tepidisphaeraceae bacterium]